MKQCNLLPNRFPQTIEEVNEYERVFGIPPDIEYLPKDMQDPTWVRSYKRLIIKEDK